MIGPRSFRCRWTGGQVRIGMAIHLKINGLYDFCIMWFRGFLIETKVVKNLNKRSIMYQSLIDEIQADIRNAAGGQEPAVDRRYHKHDQYITYNIRTAVYREIIKGYKSRVMAMPLDERLKMAHDLFALHIGTLGHTAIQILAWSIQELTPEHFPQLDIMMDHYRSWSHVDSMCLDVLQPMLTAFPQETIEQLELWNRSENRWKRRTSVVVFVRSAGKSGHYTDIALGLCENLVWDTEDIVQKGVGWALKDLMRGDRERIIEYVKDLRKRGVSAVITLYAIRDLKGAERQEILALGR